MGTLAGSLHSHVPPVRLPLPLTSIVFVHYKQVVGWGGGDSLRVFSSEGQVMDIADQTCLYYEGDLLHVCLPFYNYGLQNLARSKVFSDRIK